MLRLNAQITQSLCPSHLSMRKLMFKALFTDLDGVIRHWDNQRIHSVEETHGLSKGFLFQYAFSDDLLTPTITGLQGHDEWFQQVEAGLRKKTNKNVARQLMAAWSEATYSIDYELLSEYRRVLPAEKLVLVTNATDRLSSDLNASCLHNSFDVVVNSSEIGYAKPDPRFYERALEIVDIPPSSILFIDDSLKNVQIAIEYGFEAIHFSNRPKALCDLQATAHNQAIHAESA
jgi:putative hydrolase of the HAD superfamily